MSRGLEHRLGRLTDRSVGWQRQRAWIVATAKERVTASGVNIAWRRSLMIGCRCAEENQSRARKGSSVQIEHSVFDFDFPLASLPTSCFGYTRPLSDATPTDDRARIIATASPRVTELEAVPEGQASQTHERTSPGPDLVECMVAFQRRSAG
jgi:hypothetical protein